MSDPIRAALAEPDALTPEEIGAALILALQKDYSAIDEMCQRKVFSWPDGEPIARLARRELDLVPGKMHCAKCKFSLLRRTLYVQSGTMGAGGSETEPCPNGCGPLWPVTWEQEAREGYEACERLFDRAKDAEDALAAVRAAPVALVPPVGDAGPVLTTVAGAAIDLRGPWRLPT